MTETAADRSVRTLRVLPAHALRVVSGAHLGDPLCPADALVPEDVYRLAADAVPHPLRAVVRATPPFAVAADSATGTPGAALHLDCVATFMTDDGTTVDILILVEAGVEPRTYALPLGDIAPRTDHTLVGIDRDGALQRFARLACLSFTRGTLIALAGGRQVPVETLREGDRVMTRDAGAQTIRWVGSHTARATGDEAPVCIRAGTLNNARDLLVSPDHRLFVYQRHDTLGAGRAELFVRARHLVNGDTIRRIEGGFVDYHQMLLDGHHVLFAEGIAAESMLADAATHAVLPDALRAELAAIIPAHAASGADALEVQARLLADPRAADLLRRAAAG